MAVAPCRKRISLQRPGAVRVYDCGADRECDWTALKQYYISIIQSYSITGLTIARDNRCPHAGSVIAANTGIGRRRQLQIGRRRDIGICGRAESVPSASEIARYK